MRGEVVHLSQKLDLVTAPWSPRIVEQVNQMHVKVGRGQGEFPWHTHGDTDELFMVIDGAMRIEMRDHDPVTLAAGDLYVVPRGIEHRPVVEDTCRFLLLEPAGTINTGDTDPTGTTGEWL
jgi:mannose-6-phosphate isomerase-like protein (cupin superfamily)